MLKTPCSIITRYQCFFNLLLNSGNVLENFTFFGVIFHNIAPQKFSEFIPYSVVLVRGNFTTLPQLKCKTSHGSQKNTTENCGFNLFTDLKISVAKNCKCFR